MATCCLVSPSADFCAGFALPAIMRSFACFWISGFSSSANNENPQIALTSCQCWHEVPSFVLALSESLPSTLRSLFLRQERRPLLCSGVWGCSQLARMGTRLHCLPVCDPPGYSFAVGVRVNRGMQDRSDICRGCRLGSASLVCCLHTGRILCNFRISLSVCCVLCAYSVGQKTNCRLAVLRCSSAVCFHMG